MENKIYNNYFSGSVSQVSDCLEIILFNKSNIGERISLYNIESFYLKYLVGTSEIYTRLTRESSDESFEYKKYLEDGFNVIVYLSPISNSPIGFTEFLNTQGVNLSLNIWIDIKRTLDGEIDIILQNQLTGKDLTKEYGGKEPYEYSLMSDLTKRKYRNLFTSDVDRLKGDRSSFIVGSLGLVTKEGTWKLKIRKDIEVEYENFEVCFYNGYLVLATWEGQNYKLESLTTPDTFTGTTEEGIRKIVGRYFIDTEGVLRCLETGRVIEKTKRTQFCDYQDPRCKVYDLPEFYSKSSVFKYIPEINNIYLDLDNYINSNQLIVNDKRGSWFILSRNYGGTNIYLAVSPTSVVTMTEEDLERTIFVGDQTLILCESDYYVVYNTCGTDLMTERARVILEGGRLDYYTIHENTMSKILYCFLDTSEDQSHFEEYYGSGLVNIVFDFEDMSDTVLSRYRRNIYPKCEGIPKLIGSYGGLIFYNNNNKVNYL